MKSVGESPYQTELLLQRKPSTDSILQFPNLCDVMWSTRLQDVGLSAELPELFTLLDLPADGGAVYATQLSFVFTTCWTAHLCFEPRAPAVTRAVARGEKTSFRQLPHQGFSEWLSQDTRNNLNHYLGLGLRLKEQGPRVQDIQEPLQASSRLRRLKTEGCRLQKFGNHTYTNVGCSCTHTHTTHGTIPACFLRL